MRIRIIKAPPAPLMDGFDVRDLRIGLVFEVDGRKGHYLIAAGYAVHAADDELEASDPSQH